MTDIGTEARMRATEKINREGIPESYDGPTWDTQELQRDYTVEGFAAPCVVVRRKSDGARGTLFFTHSPRVYYGWGEA